MSQHLLNLQRQRLNAERRYRQIKAQIAPAKWGQSDELEMARLEVQDLDNRIEAAKARQSTPTEAALKRRHLTANQLDAKTLREWWCKPPEPTMDYWQAMDKLSRVVGGHET